MSYAEFCDWVAFYLEHPFDDEHRYHRPAALVSESMASGGMQDKLSWLKGSSIEGEAYESTAGSYSEADLRTLEALGMRLGTRTG